MPGSHRQREAGARSGPWSQEPVPGLFALRWSFRTTYITVSWLCWVPNLLIAEWLVHRRRGLAETVS